MGGPPITPDVYEGEPPKGKVKESPQTATQNMTMRGPSEKIKQTICQEEVESIMEPSEHTEELLEA